MIKDKEKYKNQNRTIKFLGMIKEIRIFVKILFLISTKLFFVSMICQVQGLCGNYNDDKTDDLEMSTGEITTDYNEFARSYQVEECLSVTNPIYCSETDKQKWYISKLFLFRVLF